MSNSNAPAAPAANFMAPPELSKALVGVGEKKAAGSVMKLFVLGILAGVFIGFAAHVATTVATGEWPGFFGLKKFFIGAVFTCGLMLVIIPGSELWTGNNLMTVALMEKRITFGALMRNWIIVYLGNLVGSILLAAMIGHASGLLNGSVGSTAINIAVGKVSADVPGIGHNGAYFFRAIACNWLVCLAVMMAIAAKDIAGKILAIFPPIMAFVTSGYEHAIANMYFLPAGIFAARFDKAVVGTKAGQAAIASAELSGAAVAEQAAVAREAIAAQLGWVSMWTQNLVTVTIGNFIGGAICVGVVYWFLYVREAKKA
jgi:formate/nitrite transporter